MGRLYKAAMWKAEMKRQFVLDELKQAGVTQHQGKPLENCTYEDLKSEMVLLTFRRMDKRKD